MYRMNRNPRRMQVPTIFPIEPKDCDHSQHWYVTPGKNICGTCGTELPKPSNRGEITVHSMSMAELMARRFKGVDTGE